MPGVRARGFLSGLAVAAVITAGGVAKAAVVVGSFAGTVTSGSAFGNFGYAAATDLAGKAITGTFTYDTSVLGPNCPSGTSFFGCFLGAGGVTITQTINGVTMVFPSAAPPGEGAVPFNDGQGGVLLYNLAGNTMNLHTGMSKGAPASVYTALETGLALSLPNGTIADATNPVVAYSGPAGSGTAYVIEGQTFQDNQTSIYEITGGNVTQSTNFTFVINSFSSGGAVPEPTAWSLMILGFGIVGARQRRRMAARQRA